MRFSTIILLLTFQHVLAQPKEVSITIDDVPNVQSYKQDGFKSLLLEHINELNLPVAIFINEKNINNNEFKTENIEGLKKWLKNKNITAGNHSYSHLNYADTTLKGFQQDIIQGEIITTKILNRKPSYFRFPFNSMGKDSMEHVRIQEFLKNRGYTNTPFTIESEDWAYNALYADALKKNNLTDAKRIGQRYIFHTLELFEYFETLSLALHGRSMKHIYLCHDNQLNTDYLGELIKKLSDRGYKFITLEKALEDQLYQSTDYYTGRYGFSWIYRWEKNEPKRKTLMRNEPTDELFQSEYAKFENKK